MRVAEATPSRGVAHAALRRFEDRIDLAGEEGGSGAPLKRMHATIDTMQSANRTRVAGGLIGEPPAAGLAAAGDWAPAGGRPGNEAAGFLLAGTLRPRRA